MDEKENMDPDVIKALFDQGVRTLPSSSFLMLSLLCSALICSAHTYSQLPNGI